MFSVHIYPLIFLSLVISTSCFNIESMVGRPFWCASKIMPMLAVSTMQAVQQHGRGDSRHKSDAEVIEPYLKELDAAMASFDTTEVLGTIIAFEKLRLIRDILDSSGSATTKSTSIDMHAASDQEDYLFEPCLPIPLSRIEQEKDVYRRISEKYIGTIPHQVHDVIFYFSNHGACINNRVEIFNRLLCYGEPGVGKTYLTKVLAQELQLPLFSISASTFADKYVGQSARRVRNFFDAAKKLNKPALIFIDEIDAIATARSGRMHEEHRGALVALLTELHALQDNKNLFIIVATNVDPNKTFNAIKPEETVLDPAIKDRFAGSVCKISMPLENNGTELIMKIFKDKCLPADASLAQALANSVAHSNPACSVRDIEQLIMSARLKQFRDQMAGQNSCLCPHLDQALKLSGKTEWRLFAAMPGASYNLNLACVHKK